jgi:uncharacterized protein YjbI with pentapeptide repeats
MNTNRKRTGFEDKTLWDKLNLFGTLAIPLVVVLATIAFGWWQVHLADLQHQSDQKIANQQHEADKQSALDQQQAAILQTYIDNIQNLLLHDNLRGSKAEDEVAILARARTLTALQGLDPDRKGRLVQFIYEAQLIGFEDSKNNLYGPIIDLTGANLSGVTFSGSIFFSVNLSFADLSGANLSFADLSSADLQGAKLSFADLSGADLQGADLSGANLSFAKHLTQQQLDQVSSCNGAFLLTGLTCHHNQ